MKKIVFVLLSLVSFHSIGQNKNDSLTSFISSKIDSMPNGFAISIAILRDTEVSYIGLVKEDDKVDTKNLEDSLFEIGSLTKIFTSTLLANEVLNTNLKINDPINKSFPFKFHNRIKITHQDLANHTSGLYRLPSNIFPLLIENPDNPYKEYSFALFDEYLKNQLTINEVKKSKYSYSNLGAGLLAYSLSKRRQKPFDSLLIENIFSRYKMSKTYFKTITSYDGISAEGKTTENWKFNAMSGAGGLISSSSDLSKFIIAQFNSNNSDLSLTRQATHSISDNMSIGLGWHILTPEDSDLKYWHNGGTGGFTSSVSFRITNKTGVIILSNISALHKHSGIIDELCFELLDQLK
ncbi:MAG: beta-lactamase family protein [Crocinitomicaceae bacterium]|nr:beta-lactamase family protein [Crocinitomicaceae bacterium]